MNWVSLFDTKSEPALHRIETVNSMRFNLTFNLMSDNSEHSDLLVLILAWSLRSLVPCVISMYYSLVPRISSCWTSDIQTHNWSISYLSSYIVISYYQGEYKRILRSSEGSRVRTNEVSPVSSSMTWEHLDVFVRYLDTSIVGPPDTMLLKYPGLLWKSRWSQSLNHGLSIRNIITIIL